MYVSTMSFIVQREIQGLIIIMVLAENLPIPRLQDRVKF